MVLETAGTEREFRQWLNERYENERRPTPEKIRSRVFYQMWADLYRELGTRTYTRDEVLWLMHSILDIKSGYKYEHHANSSGESLIFLLDERRHDGLHNAD